ncbi:hypothetical protein RvY_02007 [Ramazzottius varieornatus]|uniref:Uncharacterized protein n=1 Tax=Ramazzottius varieornatus TaxID=947166 RepID=A0A1D1UTF1_RAMVA|nr:hypothetical protein RvY_02007 [Ramazzottius varieornatus]
MSSPIGDAIPCQSTEKCQIMEEWLPEVRNLEDLGCPKYEELTEVPKSTRNKALIFALWHASQTSSQRPR